MHSRTPKTGVTTLAEQSKQPTIVGRGRNQERAIALPPPEIFADMMAFTCSTRKLFLETAWPLRELLLMTVFFAFVYVALCRMKQLMHHASENSQHRTENWLWGASCEVKHPFHKLDFVVVTSHSSVIYRLLTHTVAIVADLLLNLAGFSHCYL